MNMWCTGLLCFLLNPFMDRLRNKSENIIEIIPSEEAINTNGRPIVLPTSRSPNTLLNNKPIVYEPTALKAMREYLRHDQWLRHLPFGLIDRVRKLKLNNKPIKDKLHLRQQFHQYKANNNNLIRVKSGGYKADSRIIFATCNIQSLRNKELQVSQLISDYSLDFLVLTDMA